MDSLPASYYWAHQHPRCPDDIETSCNILHDDPLHAFQNTELLPDHFCPDIAAAVTNSWAVKQLEPVWSLVVNGSHTTDGPPRLPEGVLTWPSNYPLPIGKEALRSHGENLGIPDLQTHADLLAGFAGFAGFDNLEFAAIIFHIELPTATITFFGLAEPFSSPSDMQADDSFIARVPFWIAEQPSWRQNIEFRLANHHVTVSGSNPYRPDVKLVNDNLQRWWRQFAGKPLRGRPPGSGLSVTAEDVSRKYWEWTDEHGRPPTQDDLASKFFLEREQFNRRLSRLYNDEFRWPPPHP